MLLYSITVHILNFLGVVQCPGVGKIYCQCRGNFFLQMPGEMARVGIERDMSSRFYQIIIVQCIEKLSSFLVVDEDFKEDRYAPHSKNALSSEIDN